MDRESDEANPYVSFSASDVSSPRKNAVLPVLVSVVTSGIVGVLLGGMAFGFAWGYADYRVGNAGNSFMGGWLLFLIVLCSAAVVAFFASRPLKSYWWIACCIISVPTLFFIGPTTMRNVGMGNLSTALILPLVLVPLSILAGGLLGRR